jgi:hypothetical protein
MNKSSLKDNTKLSVALAAGVKTTDGNGATIDTQGYEQLRMIAIVGPSGDTLSGSLKAELELEHSDDGSAWSDCADTDLVAAVTGTNPGTFAVIDDAAEDETVYQASYIGKKRYVRVVYNVTGTHTNGMPVGVVAELGSPRHAPTV